MIPTSLVLFLLAVHWFADFVLQTDKQARGKSTSNALLSQHVGVYTGVLFIVTAHPWFALVNGVLHWGVDWCTSRVNARLWAQGRVHDFFVSVGFDQLIHTTTLVLTAQWLLLA